MRLASTPLAELSERDLTLQAIGTKTNPGLARMLGWRCFHVLRMKGSEAGFPDWLLVRERTAFIELKRADGRVSDAQKEWLAALLAAGAEVYLIRPRDLEALAKVLAQRGDPFMARGEIVDVAARLRDGLRLEIGAEGKAA